MGGVVVFVIFEVELVVIVVLVVVFVLFVLFVVFVVPVWLAEGPAAEHEVTPSQVRTISSINNPV